MTVPAKQIFTDFEHPFSFVRSMSGQNSTYILTKSKVWLLKFDKYDCHCHSHFHFQMTISQVGMDFLKNSKPRVNSFVCSNSRNRSLATQEVELCLFIVGNKHISKGPYLRPEMKAF